MPFSYFGAKHGLARYYPAPLPRGPIIEPFAGAAGYSVYWAEPWRRVLLFDKDQRLVDTWRLLQRPDALDYLDHVEADMEERMMLDNVLTMHLAGAPPGKAGRTMPDTYYPRREWHVARRRIEAALPRIRHWEIVCASYEEVGNRWGTWFLDPPYVVQDDGRVAGDTYVHAASLIDYDHLAQWSRTRRGAVIVCEQMGADWLPFRPFRAHHVMATASRGVGSQRRVEVVWTQGTASSLTLGHNERAERARRRRAARIRATRTRTTTGG